MKDTGQDVIAASMQLIAGRTAQEYNERKGRHGAFWEDRYHATAVEANEHLHRCLVYIDFNMVRAGVVGHPGQWKESGFSEIQDPPKRYRIVDLHEPERRERLCKSGRFSKSPPGMERATAGERLGNSTRSVVGSDRGWESGIC